MFKSLTLSSASPRTAHRRPPLSIAKTNDGEISSSS